MKISVKKVILFLTGDIMSQPTSRSMVLNLEEKKNQKRKSVFNKVIKLSVTFTSQLKKRRGAGP